MLGSILSEKSYIFFLDHHPPLKMGEGQNFEQSNCRMINISNLKINERSNVERPNLRE